VNSALPTVFPSEIGKRYIQEKLPIDNGAAISIPNDFTKRKSMVQNDFIEASTAPSFLGSKAPILYIKKWKFSISTAWSLVKAP
jgi:hypothetical protein